MATKSTFTIITSIAGKYTVIDMPRYVVYPTYIICGLYHLTNAKELFKFPVHLTTGYLLQSCVSSVLLSYMLSFLNPLVGQFVACGLFASVLFNWYKNQYPKLDTSIFFTKYEEKSDE